MSHPHEYEHQRVPPPPPPPPRPRGAKTVAPGRTANLSAHASPVTAGREASVSRALAGARVEQTPIAVCSRVYFTRRDLLDAAPDDPVRASEARAQWCRYIADIGRLCGFPLETTCTAMMLYHRFYAVHSLSAYAPQDASVACIFVACKVEETLKRLRDILSVALQLDSKDNKLLDVMSPEFEAHRQRIIGLERLVLQALCFDFRVRHPSTYVIRYEAKIWRTKRGVLQQTDVCLQMTEHYCSTATAADAEMYKGARTRIQLRLDRASLVAKHTDGGGQAHSDSDAKRQRVLAAGKQDTIRYVVHPQLPPPPPPRPVPAHSVARHSGSSGSATNEPANSDMPYGANHAMDVQERETEERKRRRIADCGDSSDAFNQTRPNPDKL
ncbi:cyclin-like protein [Thamnocephalis sphaerospora]|uniref:Cyclin-like protein n=1 Tax=Thamnocephalis sphaerospora TaxID=78915 RepID=A0A4P9XNC5_9FUNG|nr:cyclin-like protein [Thamnocephalis sphaerospora]|eukprot:RKP07444.1 cyclin-like protein [Thamnocephalis sphaerospora]